MKDFKKTFGHATLSHWLAVECTVVVIASVMTFALVDFFGNVFVRHEQYDPISAIGMIIPMAIVVGCTSWVFNKRFNQYVSKLTDGLSSVAGGDFSVQLEDSIKNPLGQAYEDFNKMVRELDSVQTLRTDFINNFSHEFKTPITAIQGFSELLLDPSFSQEEKQQYIQIIADESSRLASLSSNTLFLSRLESQQVIENKEEYLLDEQIKQCAIVCSHLWEQKHLTFSADLEEEISFYGNEELMRHVWINLIQNAIKYTPEGGEISVSMKTEGDNIVVQVEDTGIGMNEEVLSHVFDKYYQGDCSHTGKGLGLGLSIVRRIVELSGGTITVRSIPDQGSCFTVILPSMRM